MTTLTFFLRSFPFFGRGRRFHCIVYGGDELECAQYIREVRRDFLPGMVRVTQTKVDMFL